MKYLEIIPDFLSIYGVFISQNTSQLRQEMSNESIPFSLRNKQIIVIVHQSFVFTAPLGPGNSGSFKFSVFKARSKAGHCGFIFVVKSLLKAPAPRMLTIIWNNSW